MTFNIGWRQARIFTSDFSDHWYFGFLSAFAFHFFRSIQRHRFGLRAIPIFVTESGRTPPIPKLTNFPHCSSSLKQTNTLAYVCVFALPLMRRLFLKLYLLTNSGIRVFSPSTSLHSLADPFLFVTGHRHPYQKGKRGCASSVFELPLC